MQRQKPFASALALDGQMSRIKTQKTVVVRSERDFAALWKQHTGAANAPAVDFKKYDVVAAFAGEKRTGGHSVRFDGIQRGRRSAVVHVTFLSPAPDMFVTQALTYPWALQAVPKLPARARFVTRSNPRPIGR
jgi:hypothetical protein